MSLGLSVVVCCHNSAKRLPETLAHLARQEVSPEVPWEVIVVDNASTDDTARVAEALWPDDAPAPLRVVQELEPGLSHARRRGIAEARYGIIGFVDDDNWLAPDWVQRAVEVMAEHPEVGACGGYSEAVCQVPPPDWFERYKWIYAVGPESQAEGEVPLLWGAGLILRRSAWDHLVSSGFRSHLTGRKGAALSAGEDTEVCLALRLAGWKLWYDPRLRLKHFIPAARLDWSFLRRLHRGSAASTVGHDPYYRALQPKRAPSVELLKRRWQWQSLGLIKGLLLRPRKLWLAQRHPMEGDDDVFQIEGLLGRLGALIEKRKVYSSLVRDVQVVADRYS